MAQSPHIVVVGAGPAGLIAAETCARAGARVSLHERMPSPARKFLMAGRGGLNLTHSEPLDVFVRRYASPEVEASVRAFQPSDLVAWAEGLGQTTFTGSSGRVFPTAFKASPLLRAWLARLADLGIALALRSEWTGFDARGRALFRDGAGATSALKPDALVLALGGASWPRLGADGSWVAPLEAVGVSVAPLTASNGGVRVDWSETFAQRFQGEPIKNVRVSLDDASARGDLLVTARGLEGGPIYALGRAVRARLAADGVARLVVDLRPDLSVDAMAERLGKGRAGKSLSSRLAQALKLSSAASNLLREAHGADLARDCRPLAAQAKAVPVVATGAAGLERAISTAGGVRFDGLDERLMARAMPGVFVAGEMLDWDAPTGGYLLQACFATGIAAARGALDWAAAGRA